MDMDSKKKILKVTEEDIGFILKRYLREYQYHNNNELPNKIVFANVPHLELTESVWEDNKGKKIPIIYKGGASAASRPVRTPRANKPAPAKRGGGSRKPEPAKHE